jgi:hypothetical protein
VEGEPEDSGDGTIRKDSVGTDLSRCTVRDLEYAIARLNFIIEHWQRRCGDNRVPELDSRKEDLRRYEIELIERTLLK